MRRKIISFLCVLCLAVTMCATVFAAEGGDTERGNTKLSLSAELNQDKTQVSVTVAITETTPVPGIQFDVNYDPTKLQYADVKYGTVFNVPASNPELSESSVRLVAYMSQGDTEETGPVATYIFDVKDGATGDITFSVTNLKVSGADSTITPSEITVTIEPDEPSSSEPEEPSSSEPESSSSSEPEEPSSSKPEEPSSDSEISSSKPVDSNSSKPADSSKPDEAPSTGDNSNMIMYVIIAIVCLGAMTAVVVYRNKVHN